jgi:hypothetical protein
MLGRGSIKIWLKWPGAQGRFVFGITLTLNLETGPGSSLDGSGTGVAIPRTG